LKETAVFFFSSDISSSSYLPELKNQLIQRLQKAELNFKEIEQADVEASLMHRQGSRRGIPKAAKLWFKNLQNGDIIAISAGQPGLSWYKHPCVENNSKFYLRLSSKDFYVLAYSSYLYWSPYPVALRNKSEACQFICSRMETKRGPLQSGEPVQLLCVIGTETLALDIRGDWVYFVPTTASNGWTIFNKLGLGVIQFDEPVKFVANNPNHAGKYLTNSSGRGLTIGKLSNEVYWELCSIE